jgi:hypothetical protein
MKFYEKEFNTIVKDFQSDLKVENLKISYSILGSALMESQFLLVGNNWGGDENQKSQVTMPLVNDILVEPNNSTYRGYLDFFTDIFKGNKALAVQFLNRVVYTNGNLIRTPNESAKYNEILKSGRILSKKYLAEIIKIVKPSTIICFGNSEDSATSAITKILLNDDVKFWELEQAKAIQTINKWNTYQIKIESMGKQFNIYSFPHSSRYGTWKKDISENENFKSLQKTIK